MKSNFIRGLSLTRPWPWTFLCKELPAKKRVENRSWRPPQHLMGQYLALHAAKSWDEDDCEWIEDVTGLSVPREKESPHSIIFAVCKLSGFVEDESDERLPAEQRMWFFGPYGWLLTDFVALREPVACKGAQGLWGFEKKPDVLTAVRQQYALAATA